MDRQPFIRDLQRLHIKLLVPHAIIKKTSIELVHTFTDSVFQFTDHESFPSQVNTLEQRMETCTTVYGIR